VNCARAIYFPDVTATFFLIPEVEHGPVRGGICRYSDGEGQWLTTGAFFSGAFFFGAFPFLWPLPLDLLGRRPVGMVDTTSWIGTNLDDIPRFPPSMTMASANLRNQ
jgi:hypothetical protein